MVTSIDTLAAYRPRSLRAALQIGFTALGTVVVLGSLIQFAVVFASMSRSESGFAEGLAVLLFGLYLLTGFVLISIGLLLPREGDGGVRFSRQERRLLGYGVVAPVVGVLAVPIGAMVAPPLPGAMVSAFVIGVAVLVVSGPLATLLVVGSKVAGWLSAGQ